MKKVFTFLMLTALFAPLALNAQNEGLEPAKNMRCTISRSELMLAAQQQQGPQTVGNNEQKAPAMPLMLDAPMQMVQQKDVDFSLLPTYSLGDYLRSQQKQQAVGNNELKDSDAPMTRDSQITLLTQNFDNMSSIPTTYSATDWYAYNAGSGNNWTLNTYSDYAYSGSKSAQVQYNYSNAANCYLVSAPFTVSAGMTELSVSLYERVRSSSYGETFEVFFVKANDVTTVSAVASATKYNAIASASYTNTTYAQQTGSVTSSALVGQDVRVVVHCTSAANKYYLYVDDIIVTETTNCSAPAGLAVSNITNNSATITWGGESGSTYDVEYGILSGTPALTNGSWLKYDNGTRAYNFGDETEYDWTWAAMYPASMLNGKNVLSKVSIYEDRNQHTNDIRVDIYSGGTTAPGTLLYTETFAPSGSTGFHEVTLATPVAIDPTQNLWISLTTVGTFVVPICESTEANNQWVELGDGWYNIDVLGAAGYGWMIRGYLQEYDYSNVSWTALGTQSSPYELTNLAPETSYAVRVRTNCGTNNYSQWIATNFTTFSDCAEPFDLAVTNITSSSATLSWSGVQDVYNVSCKKVLFYEDFEGGEMPNGWTTFSQSNDSYTWLYANTSGTQSHSGTGVMTSPSSVNSSTGWIDFEPDHWLVTPLLDLQGTMSVWVRSQNNNLNFYQEHFAIYLSTSGTNAEDFNITLVPESETTIDYVEYTADLSSYVGQQGYIAIRHFNCNGQLRINIDDFGIYDDIHTATVNGNTITVDNLLPGTTYTWQVQGANCDGNGTTTDWSSTANFRTLPDCGIQELPYVCGFETEEEYECMTIIGSDFNLSSTMARTGNYCFRFDGLNGHHENNWQRIIFPEFSGTSAMELSFYYRIADANSDQFFYLGWGPDLDHLSYGDIMIADNTDYQEYIEVFPRGTKFIVLYIAGRLSGTYESYFLIDDININGGCINPRSLEADNITPNTADVSWGDYADEYNVRYRTIRIVSADLQGTPFSDGFESGTLDNWRVSNQDDTSAETDWGVRSITGVDPHGGTYFASSRSFDGDDNDYTVDNWLITPQMTLGNVVEFYLKENYPAWLDDVNVLVSKDGATFVSLAEPVVTSAEWQKVTVDLGQYAGQTAYIAILHQDYGKDYVAIDDFRIDNYHYEYEYGEWQTMTSRTNEATLPGLTPETMYEVQVQSACGNTDWSPAITFTTPSGCTAPIDLAADDITPFSATLSWSDYQESYDVRYRGRVFYEGFDRGIPSTWTTIDADNDGNNWEQYRFGIDNTTCAGSASYLVGGGGALTPDNWLITPQIDLGGFLEVWVKGQDHAAYAEHYTIYVSTTGTNTSDFTALTQESTTTNVFQKVTVDLSSYDGQKGYIAIRHHNCTDQNYFCVDDFGVYKTNDWTTKYPEDPTLSVSDLLMNTEYVWQVKGESCVNWSVPATFSTPLAYILHIDGYTSSSNGWNLIASPIGQVDPENVLAWPYVNGNLAAPAQVTNMVSGNYDLYYYDQEKELEWITYREGGTESNPATAPGYDIEPGMGYLYANGQTVDLLFVGSAYGSAEGETGVFSLTYSEQNSDPYMHGWNLVGNPFPVEATVGEWDYMRMSNDHNEIILYDPIEGLTVNPMEGIFVHATADGGDNQKVTFTPTTTKDTRSSIKAKNSVETIVVNLSKDQKLVDRAMVRFGEGRDLPKYQLSENSTKVYFPVDGVAYSVVRSEGVGELPVSFKAEENGVYTLSLNSNEVRFGYLHLIDNMTGNDVNLLETPNYSFEASTTDYSHRFKLVFATGDDEDSFAYFSNGSFIINNDGKATVQVIDVTGRILKSESINGCANVSINEAAGVYVIRLINGDNVKVQKVVVK